MHFDGRSIVGYFTDRADAEAAKEQLVRAGLSETRLDTVPAGAAGSDLRPVSGGIDVPADPSLGAGGAPDDAPLLLAADPAVADLAHGDLAPGELAQGDLEHSDLGNGLAAWLIVTVTNGSDAETERAVKIIKSHGGDM